jgi:hypothetical protein
MYQFMWNWTVGNNSEQLIAKDVEVIVHHFKAISQDLL